MNIIVALILTFGAGVSKLYLSSNIGIMFWIGIFSIILFIIIFVLVSKNIHKNIDKLEEL